MFRLVPNPSNNPFQNLENFETLSDTIAFGIPLLQREIPMAWGSTTNSLTPEINLFQYAIESKCQH